MEVHQKSQGRENPSSLNSPNSSSISNIAKNGAVGHIHSPRTIITRSETNPCPTTFVQADTSNFKQVVQMLTGSATTSETAKHATKTNKDNTTQGYMSQLLPSKSATHHHHHHHHVIPTIKTAQKRQQGFRLYERRNQLKNTLMINTFMPGFSAPETLSPSMLDFPKLALNSPVTPLTEDDPFNKNSPLLGGSSASEEEKAIAQKGFYLHPSPRTGKRADTEPRLLPLFPVESPKLSHSSS